MKKIVIDNKYKEKKIYYVVKKEFPSLSVPSLNKAFRLKDIKVNGIRVSKDYIVKLNDLVEVYINDDLLYGVLTNIYYPYEDENILVAYKPKGVVSNFENGEKEMYKFSFEDMVKKDTGLSCTICHRLDTNTEGLIIFAKNETAKNEILNCFKSGYITKEYIALVFGKMPKMREILKAYITKDSSTGFVKVNLKGLPNSQEITTEYTVKKYFLDKNCSIISVILHTGKTHQIRAHMKYIGNPVIGDSKYCTNEINKKFKLYSQVLYAAKYSFNIKGTSKLNYLNSVTIDITDKVLDSIYKLIQADL